MMTALKKIMMIPILMLSITLLWSRVFAGAISLAESELNSLNTLGDNKEPTKNKLTVFKQTPMDLLQYPFNAFVMPPQLPALPQLPPYSPPGCPLCDSSVYSYCSHKLIHDTCCCDFPGAAIYQKPPQCAYYDCTLLYATSCYEHSLIKNCCCNNPY